MTCPQCGITGDTNFYPSTLARKGHTRSCKTCHAKYTNTFRRKNPEYTKKYNQYYRSLYRKELNEKNRQNAANAKRMVYDHYGRVCACCGETGESFLTVDHVKNDGHKHLGRNGKYRLLGASLHSWIIRNSFPADFQILCFNCNCGKNLNAGICPHKTKIGTKSKLDEWYRDEANKEIIKEALV